jgi:Tol biopolymer transport system component
MTLAPGTKLGPYQIQASLAAGGMGEVYRAKDTRLDRTIAIKVLPESVATDAERLRRFEQEAKAVAALNHPNILSVHDIGAQAGTHYIVTELLDGQTLREKLSYGPLPSRRAADYGLQIAQGLASAHEKGVIHRDVKPENLFVTQDGRVKILDFGLAKQNPLSAHAAADGATLASMDVPMTTPGMVLGTIGYMSPEQVRSDSLDHRTDIFSFGAVLYEMLSGRRAFKRETAAETMTAILKEEPPDLVDATTPVPGGVERIMRRCLEKSPGQRFQSAKDLAFALEALSGTSQTAVTQPVRGVLRRNPWSVVGIAVSAIALAALVYVAGWRHTSSPARFERVTYQRGFVKGARFTPDGQNVVYSAAWEGRPYEAFAAHIGDRNARPLELKGCMVVGVSAAGEIAVLTNVRGFRESNWVQFGTLARAPAGGGAAREILEDVYDADITRDGKQFAVVHNRGPQQLEYPIGKILFQTNGYISHPRISPDGRLVAFLDHPIFGDDRGYVALVDADGKVKRLSEEFPAAEGLTWSIDGREIWYAATNEGRLSKERAVFAVTPEARVHKIFEVPGDITVWDTNAEGQLLFSLENIGSAQFVASPATAPEINVSVLGYGTYGAISSDGKAIAFSESGHGAPDDYMVFFRHLDGSAAIEIGEGTIIGMTPDAKYVVGYLPSQPTKLRILPTGAGDAQSFDVAPVQVDRSFISWMPSAKEFVFLGHVGNEPPRAYRMSLAGGSPRPLTNQKGAHFWNRISPDGKFVLEESRSGTNAGKNVIVDLATGKTRPAPLLDGEAPIDWDQDRRHIFAARQTDDEVTVFRVDAVTGQHEVWKQIRPADAAGVLSISHFFITPSGNAYAYSAGRVLSSLYVYSQK